MTDPQKLFAACRKAKQDALDAQVALQTAQDAALKAAMRWSRLDRAVALHTDEGMDPVQAQLVAESDERPIIRDNTGHIARIGLVGPELFKPTWTITATGPSLPPVKGSSQ